MNDLVSRLLAAIEETERFAREAANDVGEHWSDGGKMGESVYQEDSNGYVACGPYDYMSWELRRFIAHNDPASVLRRCASDRRTVMDWLATARDPYEGMGDDELHQHCVHPAYEYARTEGQRKAWPYVDDPPEENAGWELNITTRNPEAFERFDYTEERYWRRLRPEGPSQRRRQVPFYIRNLAEAYGISVEEET